MTTSLKRAGESLAPPPSKRSEKENSLAGNGAQRRSARDRSHQKTPLQRLEEFSSTLVSSTKSGPNFDNGKSTVLESSEVNPMAPENKKKGRGSKKKNPPVLEPASSSIQNSFGEDLPPSLPSLSIPSPTISMQQFAGIANGNIATPNSRYMYNLPLPPLSESDLSLADSLNFGSSTVGQNPQPKRVWSDGFVGVPQPQVGRSPDVVVGNGGLSNSSNFNFQPTDRTVEMTSSDNSKSLRSFHQEGIGASIQSSNFYLNGDSTLMPQVLSSGSLAQTAEVTPDTSGPFAQSFAPYSNNEQDGGVLTGDGTFESYVNNGVNLGEDEIDLESNASDVSDDGHAGEDDFENMSEDGNDQASASVAGNASGGRQIHEHRPIVQSAGEEQYVLDAHYERNRRPKPPSLYKLAFGPPSASKSTTMSSGRASGRASDRPSLMTTATDSSLLQRPNTMVRPPVAQREEPKRRPRRPTVEDYVESEDVPVEPKRRSRRATVEDYDESQDIPLEPMPRSRRATVEDYDESDDEVVSEDDTSKKARAPRYSKTPRSEKVVTPDKQEFYPPNWQIVLRMAKLLMRRWIVTQQGFPDKNQLYWKAGEILQTALNNHQMAGGFVEEGYYETHRQDMQKLIWDDISTFRGEIKNLAREFIFNYDFLPENAPNSKAFERQVIANITNLLRGAFFLRHGVDANGRPNNFCHPVLRRLILTALYSNSSKIGSRFREDFAFEVPRQALALAATAIICALEEWQTGKHKNLKFSYDDYREKHARMLGLLAELENDDYQSVKLQAMRQQWAQAGAMQGGPQAATVDMGFAVAL